MTFIDMFSLLQKCAALFLLLLLQLSLAGQKVSGKLQFTSGKSYTISAELNNTTAQHGTAQPIDFSVNGKLVHVYKVKSTGEKTATLQHTTQKMDVTFEGMGRNRAFSSGKKNDQAESADQLFPGLTERSFEITIDPAGKTIQAKPERFQAAPSQENTVVIASMLKDLVAALYPPEKGSASFFNVLPGYDVGIGDSWTDSLITNTERSLVEYKLTNITDSTIEVDMTMNSTTTEITEVMGRESKTNLKTITSCKIILDKSNGIVQEKNCKSQSSGQKEVMGAALPVTGNATLVIKVTEQ
jgi:hypothetical protein